MIIPTHSPVFETSVLKEMAVIAHERSGGMKIHNLNEMMQNTYQPLVPGK